MNQSKNSKSRGRDRHSNEETGEKGTISDYGGNTSPVKDLSLDRKVNSQTVVEGAGANISPKKMKNNALRSTAKVTAGGSNSMNRG